MLCPNKDCRDYQLTGFHAEFVDGVSVCPTCGASLVESPGPDDQEQAGGDDQPYGNCDTRGLQSDLEPVIETADHEEILLIRSLLDSSWIPHIVLAWDQLSRLKTARPTFEYEPLEGAFVFLVPTGLAEEARSVLDGIDDSE